MRLAQSCQNVISLSVRWHNICTIQIESHLCSGYQKIIGFGLWGSGGESEETQNNWSNSQKRHWNTKFSCPSAWSLSQDLLMLVWFWFLGILMELDTSYLVLRQQQLLKRSSLMTCSILVPEQWQNCAWWKSSLTLLVWFLLCFESPHLRLGWNSGVQVVIKGPHQKYSLSGALILNPGRYLIQSNFLFWNFHGALCLQVGEELLIILDLVLQGAVFYLLIVQCEI